MHILRISAAIVALTLIGAACGSSGESDDSADAAAQNIVVQGQEGLDDDAVIAPETDSPDGEDGSGGASESDPGDTETFEATDNTVPQNEDEESAIGGLFEAMAVFSGCLDDEGHAFIGQPDPEAEATDPVNDSGYIEALTKCAAVSQIQQAFAEQETESDNLDTEGIEQRNRQLVFWTDCMVGRGWIISGVTADERGLNTPTGMEPPDGQSLLDSSDLGECATIAGDEYDEAIALEEAGE